MIHHQEIQLKLGIDSITTVGATSNKKSTPAKKGFRNTLASDSVRQAQVMAQQ